MLITARQPNDLDPISKKKEEIRRRQVSLACRTDLLATLSAEICCHLLHDSNFKNAPTVGLYCPRIYEVDLTSLWHEDPNRCVFPKVIAERHDLYFFQVADLSHLSPGFGGIKEPDVDESQKVTRWKSGDLILVPGILFDRWGGRIGSGLGYYDRFLANLSVGIVKWGICLESHISDLRLPQAPHDVRMDALCTEGGILPAVKKG